MTSANLDLVRSIYAAWGRGDFSSTEWAHPEIEFVQGDGLVAASTKGLAAMAEAWRDVLSTWEKGYRTEAEEYRELDDERVLVISVYLGRGKTSGLELGQMRERPAALFHIEDGKVTRLVIYWDRENAFADLGLTPETDSTAR